MFKSRTRYKDDIFQKGYDKGTADMIKSSIKEAFTSNDPEMVAMRSQMFCQAGVPVPPPPQGKMVPLLEDCPSRTTSTRRPIDDIQGEAQLVQLTIPFGRNKKVYVAEAVLHPLSAVLDF